MTFQEARVALNKLIDMQPKLNEALGRMKSVMDAAATYEEASKTVEQDRQALMSSLAHLQAEVAAARNEYEAEQSKYAHANAKAKADHDANIAAITKQFTEHKALVAAEIAKAKTATMAQLHNLRAEVAAATQDYQAKKQALAAELDAVKAEVAHVEADLKALRAERERILSKYATA